MALACGGGMIGSTLLLSHRIRQETEPDSQLKNASEKKAPQRKRRSKSDDTNGKESTETTTMCEQPASIKKCAKSEGAGIDVRKRRRLAPATLIIAAAGWGGASLALVLLASCFEGWKHFLGSKMM